MPGPAPKHPSTVARRNNPKAGFRSLPAGGRVGDPPSWPLGRDLELMAELSVAQSNVETLTLELEEADDGRTRGRIRRALDKVTQEATRLGMLLDHAGGAEVELWNELWGYPQAVVWEETCAHREVASYCRWKIREENGDLKAAAEARQRSDRLGLNPLALMRLRQEIEHSDEAAEKGEQRRKAGAPARKTAAKKKTDPRAILSVVS